MTFVDGIISGTLLRCSCVSSVCIIIIIAYCYCLAILLSRTPTHCMSECVAAGYCMGAQALSDGDSLFKGLG